jgi:hypothetical protein
LAKKALVRVCLHSDEIKFVMGGGGGQKKVNVHKIKYSLCAVHNLVAI